MPILSKESAPGLIIATGKCALPAVTGALVSWLCAARAIVVIHTSSSDYASQLEDVILVTSYYSGCLTEPDVFLACS